MSESCLRYRCVLPPGRFKGLPYQRLVIPGTSILAINIIALGWEAHRLLKLTDLRWKDTIESPQFLLLLETEDVGN